MRLAAAFVLVLTISAAADDVRDKVDEFIAEATGGQNWEKRAKLLASLRRMPGAARSFLEAAAARPDLDEAGWGLAMAGQPILDLKRDEIADPLKGMLKGKDEKKAKFAVLVAQNAGLLGELAPELLALASSGDSDAASTATSALSNCRDARVVALLVKESGEKGERGLLGLRMLASTGADAARVQLRVVAADAQQSEDRRVEAVNGLHREPLPGDVALATALLGSNNERLIEEALSLLVEARAAVDAATLRALRRPGEEFRDASVDKLLSLAGDEEAAKSCLRRAHSGPEWDRQDWYAWAGRSGVKGMKEKLEKEFGEVTNEDARMGILMAIGECGDPGSVDLIAKYLTHPEKGQQAMKALAMLARRTPAALDAVLDRLVEVTGIGTTGIDSFPWAAQERATGAQRAVLVDGYLRLLEKLNDRPRLRQAVVSALAEMTRPDFEAGEDAVGKWKEWWKANREAFEKAPPKAR